MVREGILILGTPRSGTTLMRRVLNAHPDIACPGETYLFNGCARFLHRETFASGLDIGALAGLSFAGFGEDEVLRRLREFAFSFMGDHARAAGKPRWAEKTAFDAFLLDRLEPLVAGHVHFICLQRHGLDVVSSMDEATTKTGGYVDAIHAYIKRYSQPLEALAHVWVDLASRIAALAARHAADSVVVRYEDLCAEPERELSRVFSAIGAEFDPGVIDRALGSHESAGIDDWKSHSRDAIDASSVGRWTALPPATIRMLAEVVNPTLVDLGYDAVPTTDSPSAAEARRRYELGLRVQGMKAQQSGEPGEPPSDQPGDQAQ